MALLWGLTVFFLYLSLTAHREPVAPWMKLFATAFFAIFTLLTGAISILAYHTRYLLDPDHLTIRVGPFKSTILLSEITEVYPTRNPLSAPAWSLDRLRIRIRSTRFGALISPDRKQDFLREMETLAPQLERRGIRLVLKDTGYGLPFLLRKEAGSPHSDRAQVAGSQCPAVQQAIPFPPAQDALTTHP